jgi:hypothetical protein
MEVTKWLKPSDTGGKSQMLARGREQQRQSLLRVKIPRSEPVRRTAAIQGKAVETRSQFRLGTHRRPAARCA